MVHFDLRVSFACVALLMVASRCSAAWQCGASSEY
jgi:hypothetical protein